MRRLIGFTCEGSTLAGTLDEAPGTTGLLIVSGGNEVRAGTHRGMAMLALRVAASGIPVLRFDRRGIGDSEGPNGGWETSQADIGAAVRTFRRELPHVSRVAALGNCDAATALACFGRSAGIDALILTNPWTGEDMDGLPPTAAIRRRYRERLTDGRFWRKALSGGIDIPAFIKGLRKVIATPPEPLAGRMAGALQRFAGPVTIILATGDATAIGFRACWTGATFGALRARASVMEIATTSHSFQHPADTAALERAVLAALD